MHIYIIYTYTCSTHDFGTCYAEKGQPKDPKMVISIQLGREQPSAMTHGNNGSRQTETLLSSPKSPVVLFVMYKVNIVQP